VRTLISAENRRSRASACQEEIDRYFELCEDFVDWDQVKAENRRLAQQIGCSRAPQPRSTARALGVLTVAAAWLVA
jgi:hypothetical protein